MSDLVAFVVQMGVGLAAAVLAAVARAEVVQVEPAQVGLAQVGLAPGESVPAVLALFVQAPVLVTGPTAVVLLDLFVGLVEYWMTGVVVVADFVGLADQEGHFAARLACLSEKADFVDQVARVFAPAEVVVGQQETLDSFDQFVQVVVAQAVVVVLAAVVVVLAAEIAVLAAMVAVLAAWVAALAVMVAVLAALVAVLAAVVVVQAVIVAVPTAVVAVPAAVVAVPAVVVVVLAAVVAVLVVMVG